MAHLLDYERPLYTEHNVLPRRLSRWLVLVAIILAALPIALFLLTHGHLGGRFNGRIVLITCIGPVIATSVLAIVSTSVSITRVFPDRLQVDMFILGRNLWNYQWPWPTVIEIRNSKGPLPSGKAFIVLGRAPGMTVIMYFGTGIRLQLSAQSQVWIGCKIPEELLAAINAARNEMPEAVVPSIPGEAYRP